MTCPTCGGWLTVPTPSAPTQPAAERPKTDQVKQWMVDVRVLVQRAPPTYIKMLVEVPKGWVLPADCNLPEAAFEVVAKAIKARYPQCPMTPVKVRAADPEALRSMSGQTDFRNDSCRVWMLGRAA